MANDNGAVGPRLHLQLLGPVALTFPIAPLVFATRKAQALVVYLAVTARHHSRDALTELLWPESDEAHGRLSLRRSLTLIRQAFGEGTQDGVDSPLPHRLQTQGDAVWLALEPDDTIDLLEFTTAAHQPVQLTSLSLLQSALTRYRGSFCADLMLDDAPDFARWLTAQRVTAETHLATLCSGLIQFYVHELSETAPAIAVARQWVRHQPLHEPAQLSLFETLLAADEAAQALAVGATYRAQLADELGLQPTAEFEALLERARHSRTIRQTTPVTAGSPDVLLPFTGRGEELRRLRLAYRAASQGTPQVIILEGVAGIGKTRLLTQFRQWSAEQQADLVVGHAFEAGGRLPYQAPIAALRGRIEREHAPDDLLDDVWLIELSRLLPELRGALS